MRLCVRLQAQATGFLRATAGRSSVGDAAGGGEHRKSRQDTASSCSLGEGNARVAEGAQQSRAEQSKRGGGVGS